MDVKAALRRTRLPFVASLFLAALLGLPAVAGPVADPLPAPGAAVAATSSTVTTVAETVAAEPVTHLPPVAPADVPVVVFPGARILADEVGDAAAAPRAPPTTA